MQITHIYNTSIPRIANTNVTPRCKHDLVAFMGFFLPVPATVSMLASGGTHPETSLASSSSEVRIEIHSWSIIQVK